MTYHEPGWYANNLRNPADPELLHALQLELQSSMERFLHGEIDGSNDGYPENQPCSGYEVGYFVKALMYALSDARNEAIVTFNAVLKNQVSYITSRWAGMPYSWNQYPRMIDEKTE